MWFSSVKLFVLGLGLLRSQGRVQHMLKWLVVMLLAVCMVGWSWDGVVHVTATICELDSVGFEPWQGQEVFHFCRTVQTGSGTYLDCCSLGSRILTLGVKWLGREVDHSPVPCVEVKE
jgi:hypothetical protein